MSMYQNAEQILKRKFVTLEQQSDAAQTALGKILTILDAAIPNQTQAKAVKDLVKSAIYEMNDTLCQQTDFQTLPDETGAICGKWGHAVLSIGGNAGDAFAGNVNEN